MDLIVRARIELVHANFSSVTGLPDYLIVPPAAWKHAWAGKPGSGCVSTALQRCQRIFIPTTRRCGLED